MSDTAVAKRYAVALFQLAKERNLLAGMEEELQTVKKVFAEEKELLNFLEHPKASNDAKKNVIKSSFSGVSEPVLNTLQLMLDRRRIGEIGPMAAEFIRLADEENSTAEAVVYSVRPLTDEERTAVSAAFAEKVGKSSLKINNIADSSILGGIKVRIGNRIFDGTIQGKLDRLSKQLLV